MPRSMINRGDALSSGLYVALLTSAVYGAIYYLPLYFQAVDGASAIMSVVYLLPLIISQLITAGLSGVAGKVSQLHVLKPDRYKRANIPPPVTKIGYVIPVAVFSTVLLSIGTGL